MYQYVVMMYVYYSVSYNFVWGRQQRFAQQTQEDSHELLRHVLYELKKEEVNVSMF